MAENRSRESALWEWLKAGAKKAFEPSAIDIRRVEGAATGTPDVECQIQYRKQFWCELKVAHEMANGMWNIKITPAQVRWARKRCRAGGNSWVLVRVGSNPSRHYLIWGMDAERLLQPISEFGKDSLEQLSKVYHMRSTPTQKYLFQVMGQC